MAVYEDLFVRSYKDDTNEYPKPSKCCPWKSPDIITYGVEVCKDPKSTFLGDNFNSTFPTEIKQTVNNYIYIRGKNFAKKDQTGKIYLYWSQSQLLLSPGLWSKNVVKTTKNTDFVEFHASQDAEYVTSNDDGGMFNWIPNAIKDDHYCLISRVVTADHPAPIPDLKNIHDFSVFLRSEASMGYAQRNVSVVAKGVPEYVGEDDITNEFDEPIEEGYLIINCEKLPAGCEVALTCPGSSSTCFLEIERSKVTPNTQGSYSVSVHFYNMPAHFSTKAYLYIWFNGHFPQEAFDVKLDFISVETPNTAAYHLAFPLSSFHIDRLCTPDSPKILTGDDLGNYLADVGQWRRAIRVGACSHLNTMASR